MSSTDQSNKASGNGIAEPRVAVIPVKAIRENKVALREVDRESEDYLSLVDSVKQDGILNPIVVRELKDPETGETIYGLVDGLHRWSAAQDAGLEKIPVHVVDMEQAEVEEKQIIANAHTIETKAIEYTKQLQRVMARNPLMTATELSKKLSKTVGWLYQRFGLLKIDEKFHALVNDGKITLSNAYQLSKLKPADQDAFIEKAMTANPEEFSAAVTQRVKEIREARRQGKEAGPVEFKPVAHERPWTEVKARYEDPSPFVELLQKNNITTPMDAVKFTLAWVSMMDPNSQQAQKDKNVQLLAKKEQDKRTRDAERAQQRLQDAQKKLQELGTPVEATAGVTATASV